MGSTHRQVLRQVELPLALPVILAGVRTAAVQVLATEPLGAFFGGEGLGRYLRQGLSSQDAYEVQAGALLVTAVAIGAELAIVLASRLVVLRGRSAGRAEPPAPPARRRRTPPISSRSAPDPPTPS